MTGLLALALLVNSGTAPAPSVISNTPMRPVGFVLPQGGTRVETIETAGGGLITLFHQSASGTDVPVLSVFKDTLGDEDPQNDRLRYVWVLSHKNAAPWRHALAAIPFLYIRTLSKPPAEGSVPRAMLDLTKPTDSTVRGLARTFGQIQFLDPLGMAVRSASRSYQNNYREGRAMSLIQAASALENPSINGIPRSDLQAIRSRLLLSTKLLGGLVSDRNLPLVYEKEVTRREEMRGQNWEMIRQESENNGLYFQPLHLAGGPPSHGLVWVSRQDLLHHYYRPYSGRFLKIPNPWRDRKLRKWKGYTETRVIDGQPNEMIPLAIYGLDHPKVPHLMIAMRNQNGPRHNEMMRRALTDAATGLLGFSRFATWEGMAGMYVWDFLSGRRGSANNRAWRTRSYAEFKQRLALDDTLNPALRKELTRQLDRLAVNPLDNAAKVELETARVQYRALVAWALAPGGLARRIEKDRKEELALARRSSGRRLLTQTARWATFGLYRPQATLTGGALAELDYFRQRIEAGNQRPRMAVQEPAVSGDESLYDD